MATQSWMKNENEGQGGGAVDKRNEITEKKMRACDVAINPALNKCTGSGATALAAGLSMAFIAALF